MTRFKRAFAFRHEKHYLFNYKKQSMRKYIGYCRVSTRGQGASGLGLLAQKSAIEWFVKSSDERLLGNIFTEVESGKNDSRPKLQSAIHACKIEKATLLIAKLDRLSRNLTFISTLMDSGIPFKAVDMPEADNFTIHIFAALAQKEREMISMRTKLALQERKRQGIKLWTPENLTHSARAKGREASRRKALENPHNRQASELIFLLRKEALPFSQIADRLNQAGYLSSQGKIFHAKTAWRLYQRANSPKR
jgi:DNA invertase Pin-like site-specific DNA recombinase